MTSRLRWGFELLGSLTAWMGQVFFSSIVGEFACAQNWGGPTHTNQITATWLLGALTLFALVVAVIATLLSIQHYFMLKLPLARTSAAPGEVFVATISAVLSPVMCFIILFQGAPTVILSGVCR